MLDDVDYEIPPQKRGRFVVLEGLHGTHTQGILDDLGLIAADLDDLLGPKPKALPADDLVLPLDDNAELGQVTPVVQPQPASDMQPLVPERLVARPPGQPVPGRTQPLSDIRGRLIITGHTGQPVNDRRGAHTTDPNTRQDGEQGETAGQAHQTHQGHRTSPRQGAAPSPPRAHVPAAGAAGRTVPEGPGVIGPEPQPHSALNDPSAAPGHPQSPSRLAVPVGEGGVGAGRGDGDAGDGDTLPVTLREGYDRGLVGDGVEYETVRKARRRTARVIRERFAGDVDAAAAAGWWFPAPCGIREVKPNGERVHEYDPPELDRWWRSRPRGEPDDGVWWVYFMVQGGIGNTRWGSVVKIGYTTDLEDRCRKFGNHFPGARALAAWVEAGMPAGGPGGDIVYLEAFRSRKEARAAESAYHRRWKREFRPVRLDDDPPVGPNTSLMCWPHGGGGNSGREQFWIEGTLAAFMADVCPRGRREAS
jgi:hypothetical protein